MRNIFEDFLQVDPAGKQTVDVGGVDVQDVEHVALFDKVHGTLDELLDLLFDGLTQVVHVDEIQRHVELCQRLTALQSLQLGHRIDRQVQILELLELRQSRDLLDQIVLKVQDFQVSAVDVEP